MGYCSRISKFQSAAGYSSGILMSGGKKKHKSSHSTTCLLSEPFLKVSSFQEQSEIG